MEKKYNTACATETNNDATAVATDMSNIEIDISIHSFVRRQLGCRDMRDELKQEITNFLNGEHLPRMTMVQLHYLLAGLEKLDSAFPIFEKIDLSRMDLRGANFEWCDLRGANFDYANLRNVDLGTADTKGLTTKVTKIDCPHCCGGIADSRYRYCASCRRDLKSEEVIVSEEEVEVLDGDTMRYVGYDGKIVRKLSWCWEWWGPNDHRMRCRLPKGHVGDHDCHEVE